MTDILHKNFLDIKTKLVVRDSSGIPYVITERENEIEIWEGDTPKATLFTKQGFIDSVKLIGVEIDQNDIFSIQFKRIR
jgi:hypothetical protein